MIDTLTLPLSVNINLSCFELLVICSIAVIESGTCLCSKFKDVGDKMMDFVSSSLVFIFVIVTLEGFSDSLHYSTFGLDFVKSYFIYQS